MSPSTDEPLIPDPPADEAGPALSRSDLESMYGNVRARVDAEHGVAAWARSRSTPTRIAIGVGLGVLMAVAGFAFSPRPDLSAYPVARMAFALVLFGALFALAVAQSLRPMHAPASPRWVTFLWLAAAVLAPVAFADLPRVHEAVQLAVPAPAHPDIRCFVHGVLYSVPVLAAWVLLDRKSPRASVRLVLAAAAGGLAGNVMLQIGCPSTDPRHLLVAHASVVLALVAGAWVVSVLLRRRRSRRA